MPVNITIRAVPDEVRDELAARARRAGQSLQEYLSAELRALAARPNQRDVLASARAAARGYPPVELDDILADLDADRR